MQFVLRRARSLLAVLLIASGCVLLAPGRVAATTVPGYNGRIAFTRADPPYGTDTNGTYTVNTDGTDVVQLTHGSGVFGSYSSDGSRLAYLDTDGIDVMNADGSDKHVLVPGASTALRMAWSPDGTRFATMVSGPNGIDIIHTDGSPTDHILVGQQGDTWYPSWSPDGTKLVYWNDNQHGIMVADSDGTNAHLVVARPEAQGNWWVSFTTDGTKFVWSEGNYDAVAQRHIDRIFVADVDGANAHEIGDDDNVQPVVSPDSKWVAYRHGAADASEGIWIMRIDGSDARQVTHGPDGFPDWQSLQSPLPTYNGKLALVRSGELYTANPDGTGFADLHVATTWWPSWANDGTTVGVVTPQGYTTVAADGSDLAPHSTSAGNFASLSPDGTRLTFSRNVEGNLDDIFVSKLDGSNEVDIVARPGPDYFPIWSPDNEKVAFMGADDAGGRPVWIVNADGTNLHAVPNLPAGFAGLPRFSPDGTKLLFGNVTGSTDHGSEWYVIGIDGSNLVQVGPTDRYVNDMSFSPDGTKIVFSSFPEGWGNSVSAIDAKTGLYVMNADGTNAVQITHGSDDWATWQPRLSPPANLPPHAVGTAQNKQPLALFANGAASWDFDGTIVSYEWRWGDNTAMTPKKYAWHKYAATGTYLVRLTVTDNEGAKTTKKAWIKVN